MPIFHVVMPPANGASTTINGRTYTCAAGGTLTVPDFDSNILTANGWSIAAAGGAAPTSQRPANPSKNLTFFDTTLGIIIQYDGKVWRNPTTGAAV
jgi:hypothetical protein